MMSTKLELTLDRTIVKTTETTKDALDLAGTYTAPELHVIGKAGKLVQGGGGNTADNNRARQY